MRRAFSVCIALVLLVCPLLAQNQPAPSTRELDPSWLGALKWRTIGPSSAGGRIVDLAVVESSPGTYYVGTASGGVFKTTNNGITFTPVFDQAGSLCIGDVAVAPSNPDVVWVGTGENNARNSVSWGDGVYKSTDGGKTWQHVGLKESFQIGRIVIHPKNPDVVFVGALGRLWGTNAERGVFKTTDGGKTWEKVLYVDEKTGCIDLAMSPDDPNDLLAAMYERQRDEFDGGDPAKKWGAGSGLYRTTDGGKTWKRMTKGLPTVKYGRIGISWYQKNPKVVFAIIETEKIGTGPQTAGGAYMGIQGDDAEGGVKLEVLSNGPAERAGLKDGDIVIEFDGKKVSSYNDLTAQIRAHKPEEKVKVKVKRGEQTLEMEVTLGARPAQGGQTASAIAASMGGQQPNVQDRQGKDGFETGGVYKSTDGGESWTRVNSLNPRPFYFSKIRVDPSDDRYVYVLGISLYASEDGGKTFRSDAGRSVHSDHHAMWIDPRDGRHIILGCDGGLYETHDRTQHWEHVNNLPLAQFYHVAVDSRRLYRVYGGLQDNGSWGGPSALRGFRGPIADDWIAVGGGDGFVCQVDRDDPDLVYYESQYGRMGRVNVRTGERGTIQPPPVQGQRYRFSWKTPFILSSFNSRIFYCAGNYVFKSLDRGNKLRAISPEITRTNRGTATALAESPLNPDVLYVGTDDGYLWVTQNGGHNWTNLADNLKDALPHPWRVSAIEASRFKEGKAYVSLDRHFYDDDAPYVFVTEDFGKTWKPLRNNLPASAGSAKTIREDLKNSNLLFVGAEFGAWVSIDGGSNWTKLNNNMPPVAVHEFAIHPTAHELVAATHGRGIWIMDVTPLRQLTDKVLTAKASLFAPKPAVMWAGMVGRRISGDKRFVGENPTPGATLYFTLTEKAQKVNLKIVDTDGKTVREFVTPNDAGLHRVVWDLRRARSGGGSGVNLDEIFNRYDDNKDGVLNGEEIADAPIAALLRRMGVNPEGEIRRDTLERSLQAAASRAPATPFGQAVTAGKYRVVLTVDDKEFTVDLTVERDPDFPDSPTLLELEEQEYWETIRKREGTGQ